jgi:hypothetical protein
MPDVRLPLTASSTVQQAMSELSKVDLERIRQWREDNRPEPVIYFVECAGFIKIGWSTNWRSRLNNIQISNPLPIKVLLVIGRPEIFEKTMHRQFSKFRYRGEWFRDCQEIREYIESRKDECWHRAGRLK